MGLYLTIHARVINDFLKKSQTRKSQLRQLDKEETDISLDLRRVRKSANLCMTELQFVKEVIKKLNISDLYFVVMNFERIIHSVYRQRNLACALFSSIFQTKPSEEEKKAIRYFISSFDERISYINKIPIPENIKLTPIQDYMDFIGASNFLEEIRNLMPTGKDIFEARTNGTMDNLISNMMSTLKSVGKDELYKARVSEYSEITRKRIAKEKEEKDKERKAKCKNEAENGIGLFKELFCRGVRNLKAEKVIHLTENSVREHLNAGHRGKFCILCCGYHNGKIIYRYVASNGKLSLNFSNVSLYETIDEANKAVTSLIGVYPEKVFAPIAI